MASFARTPPSQRICSRPCVVVLPVGAQARVTASWVVPGVRCPACLITQVPPRRMHDPAAFARQDGDPHAWTPGDSAGRAASCPAPIPAPASVSAVRLPGSSAHAGAASTSALCCAALCCSAPRKLISTCVSAPIMPRSPARSLPHPPPVWAPCTLCMRSSAG